MLWGLAVMLADGGDCLCDLAALRDQPELFGPVASTATAWRVSSACQDPDGLARGDLGPGHSDARQAAAGTDKGSFGFHPLLADLDRGQAPGEPLAGSCGQACPGWRRC